MSEPVVDENSKAELLPVVVADPVKETTGGEPVITADTTNGTSSSEQPPPAKKKRGADRQMTKDDYEDDEGEGEPEIIKQGFQRASAEVLAKRKIFKVKRPTASSGGGSSAFGSGSAFGSVKFGATAAAATKSGDDVAKQETSKPVNAFGATKLVASSDDDDDKKKDEQSSSDAAPDNKPSTTKKVFGSGSAFSGFSTAVSSGTGFGAGFGGFGSAAAKTDTKTAGFGVTASGFGTVTAAGSSTTTGNLFQTAAASAGTSSGFTFGFGKKAAESKDDAEEGDGDDDAVDTTVATTTPIVQLPEVVTKTGEEDEKVIHNGRCKSHKWVPDVPEPEDDEAETAPKVANPSVKPSSAFEAAISSVKSPNKEEETGKTNGDDQAEKKDETNEDSGDKEAQQEDAETPKKKGDEAKTSSTTPSSEPQQFRWQEVGVGPIRILRSESNPEKYRMVQRRESTKNGPAHKVILNVPLWKESTSERAAPKFLTVKTLVDGDIASYSLKFKDSSDASYFHHYLTEAFSNAKSAFAGGDEEKE